MKCKREWKTGTRTGKFIKCSYKHTQHITSIRKPTRNMRCILKIKVRNTMKIIRTATKSSFKSFKTE